jgi:hypothetical protein
MIVYPNVRVGAASVVGTRIKCGGGVIGRIIIGCTIDTIFICRFIAFVWIAVSIAVAVWMNTLSETEVKKDGGICIV